MLLRDMIITPSIGGPFSSEGRARHAAFNATACNAWERDFNGSPDGCYRKEAIRLWRKAFTAIGAVPGEQELWVRYQHAEKAYAQGHITYDEMQAARKRWLAAKETDQP